MSQAICLGDIAFFLAYKIISESTFPEKEKNEAVRFFSQAIHDTVIGQMLDVAVSQETSDVSEKDVVMVARFKTAYYTFVGPLTLGAVLGGADDRVLDAIRKYGEHIGIAFQIQDDIFDIFGSEQTLKKEVGGDIKEGKSTVLYVHALEKADKEQLKILKNFYGNNAIGLKEIEAVKKVFVETDALTYARDLAASNSLIAGKSILHITKNHKIQELLRELIKFVNHEK